MCNWDEKQIRTGFTREQLTAKSKGKIAIVTQRQICMMCEFNHAQMSWTEIGRMFGRTHATVIHDVNITKLRIETKDKLLISAIERIGCVKL